jgi:hypothetical protein
MEAIWKRAREGFLRGAAMRAGAEPVCKRRPCSQSSFGRPVSSGSSVWLSVGGRLTLCTPVDLGGLTGFSRVAEDLRRDLTRAWQLAPTEVCPPESRSR